LNKFPLDRAFELLEPGPTILVTTKYNGHTNVMTMSWHTLIDFTPQIGLIISNGNYTFEMLKRSRECVVAIPSVKLIHKAIAIGNCSGSDIDKFKKFKLTRLTAKKVSAPLIKEAIYNIECKLVDSSMANKYCLFILDGVYAWKGGSGQIFHAHGNGKFSTSTKVLNYRKEMTKWF
jgi:flavin reductase (DIM6/NTAB) family NADH-FMN oxidoreductase RutF